MIGPPDGAESGGTSRELGTRIEWRSWLGPEEKSSRVWAISSFIHLLFRCQGQPFKNGQRQLNLIGIADWQLPTGNTCIVNC
ncbi:ABC transporter G family member [Trichinella spiralis]|uniref:ABC transporter G family member n=1 Tax=Trichinella spiralis TaxID=6334 RepID=A0ABR3KLI4_TRISP